MKKRVSAALSYRSGDPAPRVTAAASDELADLMRRIAALNQVPVVESPALAEALAQLNPMEYIPEEYWVAVAEILQFVYQTRGDNELLQS